MTTSSAATAPTPLARAEVDALFEVLSGPRAGGMGRVYEARERATGRRVALKLVDAGRGTDERFALEAEILARLDHPGIVGHVAYGETTEGPWLAMEWLDGETLSERLAQGPLSVREALALGIAIADALAAAHARGVVHRDLKPSNVFLVGGEPARAKVLDFGVARLREGHRDLTLTNQIVGTPGYMAPEQARGLRDVDARADLFSLGCLLFRALTGAPPFDGPDVLSVLAKLASQDPPPVGELVDDVPEPLERLVVTLLAKLPDERPTSAEGVRDELVRIAAVVDAGPMRRPRRDRLDARIECVVLARRHVDDGTASVTVDALRGPIEAAGGKLAVLGDGALLVRVDERPTSEARAEAAARCAALLTGEGWQVSVASGYTEHVPIHADSPPPSTTDAIDRASQTLAGTSVGSVGVAPATSPVERAFHRELLRAIRELGTPLELAPTEIGEAPAAPPIAARPSRWRLVGASLVVGGVLAVALWVALTGEPAPSASAPLTAGSIAAPVTPRAFETSASVAATGAATVVPPSLPASQRTPLPTSTPATLPSSTARPVAPPSSARPFSSATSLPVRDRWE